ncbi:MAG: aconitase X catalytic domain-containing protein [Rubrivivax sp.]|nr:aconitase X catalytic domain-containing protein [Rubrivivax sp.]
MIELTERDRALLGGQSGDAAALAMRVLVRSAALMGAERLLDITSAHIDGCLYHGQASLDFVERLVAGGGKVVVPTTLNVGSLDLIHPELFRGDAAVKSQAERLMQAHLELGCESTFTCAPYQGRQRPHLGQQIAWAESNAIVFANSVLGARTNRYGDFMDLCAALTGRAPACGLHLAENRHGQVLFELLDFPAEQSGRDIWFAALGLLAGKQVGARIPVFVGLPPDTNEDELKALGAACASTGAVGLFHAVGITPEAPTLAEAFGGRPVQETVAVSRTTLQRTRAALSRARPGDRLAAVSVGTPHFSLAEFDQLLALLAEEAVSGTGPRIDFYVNTSRFILWQLEECGKAKALQACGITVVTDTCTYITPVMKQTRGLVMTNSGKWAHYAPANIGVEVAFGSLRECVRSALRGEVVLDAP